MSVYSQYSDSQLMSMVNKDDSEAFAEIFNRYRGILYAHACRMLGDQEEAGDIIQELFATVWTRRREIVVTTTLMAYLYTGVRHRVLDMIAHKKVETDYLNSLAGFLEEGFCATDHLVREQLLNEIIEQEVASLPRKMRRIFELSRKQNLSYQEIAQVLNISDKTVKKQVHNALIVLRAKLNVTYIVTFLSGFFL